MVSPDLKSESVRARISQRLLENVSHTLRYAPLISDLIFKGDVHEFKQIMKKSRELGMQTFDMALFDMYETGMISYEDTLRNADSMNELRLQIKLEGKEAKGQDLT